MHVIGTVFAIRASRAITLIEKLKAVLCELQSLAGQRKRHCRDATVLKDSLN